jgi:prepilin-type N-terminal cleavage/methylation domain-containing protein
MRKHPGFTLIELLIVVAIIAILAAIAVPNFLEAQVRAKVSRVVADQRTLATALESYAVDHNKYPVRHDNWHTGGSVLPYPPFREKVFDPDAGYQTAAVGLHVITTPQAYISSLPKDIFNMPAKSYCTPTNGLLDVIDYWDPRQTDAWLSVRRGTGSFLSGLGKGWTLISVGPDQFVGVNSAGNPGLYPPEFFTTQFTGYYVYDPTNGTISTGNIYRTAGNLSASYIFSPP